MLPQFMKYRIMDSDQCIAALRALAHDGRLAAYRNLVQVGPAGLAVGELRDAMGVAAPTLSTHLNVLRHAGLVTGTREGRVIRVRADFVQMSALMAFLLENCCQGEACGAAVPASGPSAAERFP